MKALSLLFALSVLCGGLTGCGDLQTGQRTDHFTGRISNETKGAITCGAYDLYALAGLYKAIGEPGLDAKNRATFDAAFNAGGLIVQGLVGQPATPQNLAAIQTGNPAVDRAILVNVTPGATITQADADTVYGAAYMRPAGIPNSPNAQAGK